MLCSRFCHQLARGQATPVLLAILHFSHFWSKDTKTSSPHRDLLGLVGVCSECLGIYKCKVQQSCKVNYEQTSNKLSSTTTPELYVERIGVGGTLGFIQTGLNFISRTVYNKRKTIFSGLQHLTNHCNCDTESFMLLFCTLFFNLGKPSLFKQPLKWKPIIFVSVFR